MHDKLDKRPDRWLQHAANLAMSALLARLDTEARCRPFFWVDFRDRPPQAHHSYWDHCDIAGRFVDGLVLARILTGRRDGAEAEAQLRAFLWAHQDLNDGLFYNPESEEDGIGEASKYVLDAGSRARLRHVDLFCQRAPLMAMTTLLAAGDESVRPRLQAMVRGLEAIAEWNGDEARFPSYRWAPVVRPEWIQGQSAPERWHGYRYALLTALARYVELADDARATAFATALARWYMRHGDVPADGRFKGNTHSGGILPTTVGIARLGRFLGDREMLAWANRVYLWVVEKMPDFGFLTDGFGLDGFFSGTCETCGLADLMHLALVLTEAGLGDYWDDLERYARNQVLENQYTDAAELRLAFPSITEQVLAMLHGGFECAAHPNSLLTWDGAEGCCIGGGLRALYLAWRAVASETDGETRVHLGLSRSTPGAEIVGCEPWEGRVEVRVHTPRRLAIRVPGHAARAQVRAWLDGRAVETRMQDDYVIFETLQPEQTAALTYPLVEATRIYDIAGQTYTGDWRGATLMEIRPAGGRYPTYRRGGLLSAPPAPADLAQRGPDSVGGLFAALW
jgi:hypothetical protein